MTSAPTLTFGSDPGYVLITGGCGFIGCNLANALAGRGERVMLFDNLSRPGVRENAHWLKARHQNQIEVCVGDVGDIEAVCAAVRPARAVLHLAAQVAVTSSIVDPIFDFKTNANGTLNVLEALRLVNPAAPLLFASTNKVYGALEHLAMRQTASRYEPDDQRYAKGIDASAPLDFHSPYGCSKGAADQYVRDYARVYGLRTAVLRMSCVYGPRQFGNEDQGWIAHFLLRAIRGEPITIFGDGRQVRDALYVGDAVNAWLAALDQIDLVQGSALNLGGGPANTLSLLELLDSICEMRSVRPLIAYDQPRPGDQLWYVSDVDGIERALGWRPTVSLKDGLNTLMDWLETRFSHEPPQLRSEVRA